MKVTTVLKHVLKLLTPKGRWIQGVNVSRRVIDGHSVKCYCLNGAVAHVVPLSHDWYLRDSAARYIGRATRQGQGYGSDLIGFNDAPGRKKSEVLRVVRKAIRFAEADEL